MPVLTAAAVRKYAAHPSRRREIADAKGPGLYLVIQPKPSGASRWALRFRRPDGRPAKLTLGRVDLSDAETADEPTIGGALTLRQARELANRIDRERARGVDVVEEHKAGKRRRRAAAEERGANGFAAALREFFTDHKTKWHARPRHWRDDARLLGLDWRRTAIRDHRAGGDPGLAGGDLGGARRARDRRARLAHRRGRGAAARRPGAGPAQRRHVGIARSQDAQRALGVLPLAAPPAQGREQPLRRRVAAVRAPGARPRARRPRDRSCSGAPPSGSPRRSARRCGCC